MKKRVLIWGTGKSAHMVAKYISVKYTESMEVVGFYTTNSLGIEFHDDNLVFNATQVLSNHNDMADVFIIPNPGKKISDIIRMHRNIKDKTILLVPADSIRNPEKEEYFIQINIEKPWLDGFEYHVADHCNLNCKGCGHCANLFRSPSFGDFDSYERDLLRLSDLFDGIGLIRLLGGEPLLNDKLSHFIAITRKYFKHAELHVVTNGILIPLKGKEIICDFKDYGVIVDLSVYPPVEKMLSLITGILDEGGVEYNVMPVEQFYKRFSLKKRYNKKVAFAGCGTSACHALYNGKIAACIVPFSAEKLNQEFNTGIEISGWIDLYEEGITGEMINSRLKQPFSLCSHCNPEKTFFDWEQRQYPEYRLEDWICPCD